MTRPPPVVECNLQALIAWLAFEVDCEVYDRTLPGQWTRNGEYIPVNDGRVDGRRLSIVFAAQRAEQRRAELHPSIVPFGEGERARRIVQGWSFQRQMEEPQSARARRASRNS